MNKPILDACCGSKIFWFDKNNPNVEFCDIRTVPYHEYYPQRYIEIAPDTICDFTALPKEFVPRLANSKTDGYCGLAGKEGAE